MTTLWLIVLCGVLAIIYAIWATRWVLQADAGVTVRNGDGTTETGTGGGDEVLSILASCSKRASVTLSLLPR